MLYDNRRRVFIIILSQQVEFTKANNLLKQEVIDMENELAKAVQARNSPSCIQKVDLNAEAHIDSQTMRPVEPMFNPIMNAGDQRVDMEWETIHYCG